MAALVHSVIEIRYNGTNITPLCVIDETTFVSQAQGTPGTASIAIKDVTQSQLFTTGRTLELYIDGIRQWDGYVTAVRRNYWFDSHTANCKPCPHVTPRKLVLEGADRNILFQSRVMVRKDDPTNIELLEWPANTPDQTALFASFDEFLEDLTEIDLTSMVEHVGSPDPYETFSLPGPIWAGEGKWYGLMSETAQSVGAVFYIDPDRKLVYTDVDTPTAPYGISDQPSTGEIGCREMEINFDATAMINDAMVWGAGQGSTELAFSRVTDSTSVSLHGRWQNTNGYRANVWRQESVDRIANTIIYGSPTNKRGHKDDKVSVRCTIFQPGFRVADKVNVRSAVHDFLDVVPIRQMTITFHSPTQAQYDLVLSHEIDEPWTTSEFWWPPRKQDPPPPPPPTTCAVVTIPPPGPSAPGAVAPFEVRWGTITGHNAFFIGPPISGVGGFVPHDDNNPQTDSHLHWWWTYDPAVVETTLPNSVINDNWELQSRFQVEYGDDYRLGFAGNGPSGSQWEPGHSPHILGGQHVSTTVRFVPLRPYVDPLLYPGYRGSSQYDFTRRFPGPVIVTGYVEWQTSGSIQPRPRRWSSNFSQGGIGVQGAPMALVTQPVIAGLRPDVSFGSTVGGVGGRTWGAPTSYASEVPVDNPTPSPWDVWLESIKRLQHSESLEATATSGQIPFQFITMNEYHWYALPLLGPGGWPISDTRLEGRVSFTNAQPATEFGDYSTGSGRECVPITIGYGNSHEPYQSSERVFMLAGGYVPGSTRVWLDGLFQRPGIDYYETNPMAGMITFSSDVTGEVQASFTATSLPDTSVLLPEGKVFIHPIGGARITGTFGAQNTLWPAYTYKGNYYPHFHTGVDFGVPTGTPVRAALGGTAFAYTDTSGAKIVRIVHSDGSYTVYAHLSEQHVGAGQTVSQGQQIGLSGATGFVTGAHLHWEWVVGGWPENPLPYTG